MIARPDDCTACLLCELHCPDFAIEVQATGAPEAGEGRRRRRTADRRGRSGRVIAAVAGRARTRDDDERPVSGSECGVHGGED